MSYPDTTIPRKPLGSVAEAVSFIARFPSPEGLDEGEVLFWEDRVVEGMALDWVHSRDALLDHTYGVFFERQNRGVLLSLDPDEEGLRFAGFVSSYLDMSARQKKEEKTFQTELSEALRSSSFADAAFRVLKERGIQGEIDLTTADGCVSGLLTPSHRARIQASSLQDQWPESTVSKARFRF